MDLSNSLATAAKLLFRRSAETAVSIHYFSGYSFELVRVSIAARLKGKVFVGTGISDSIQSAFIRAAVETGEDIVFSEASLESSCGLAGGILKGRAIERAKLEAFERDAFIFHYRSRIPFQEIRHFTFGGKTLISYALQPATKDVHVALVTDPERAQGRAHCIIFGLGASINSYEAELMARNEYLAQSWRHEVFPQNCRNLDDTSAMTDHSVFHHCASRDRRNISIFSALCSALNGSISIRAPFSDLNWKITEFQSPLRFVHYVHMESTVLNKLQFLKAEPDSPSGHPLYIPFS